MVNLVKGLSNVMIKILRNFKDINSALIAITKVITVLGFALYICFRIFAVLLNVTIESKKFCYLISM